MSKARIPSQPWAALDLIRAGPVVTLSGAMGSASGAMGSASAAEGTALGARGAARGARGGKFVSLVTLGGACERYTTTRGAPQL
ncbi:MAG: hypothetical protein RL033_4924 [Pseudomonadota bacterium]